MSGFKLLNGCGGLGGNVHRLPDHVQATTVEHNPKIAAVNQRIHPGHTVVIGDAYQEFQIMSANKTSVVDKLYKFTPYNMLLSFGFALGDERNEDGLKTYFANVPQSHGEGSFDMSLFKGQHEPFSVCVEAVNEIERLEQKIKELEN